MLCAKNLSMQAASWWSEDQGDYVAGHVTLRLSRGDGRFLMKPAGIGLEGMTPGAGKCRRGHER
jgi:hypothetical protein